MPTEHTIPAPTRKTTPAEPDTTHAQAARTPVGPATQAMLRFVASIWYFIAVLSTLVFGTTLIALFAEGARRFDANLPYVGAAGLVMMTAWTLGPVLCWMANLSDELRAKAGR